MAYVSTLTMSEIERKRRKHQHYQRIINITLGFIILPLVICVIGKYLA